MYEDLKVIIRAMKSRFDLLALCCHREDVLEGLKTISGAIELTKLDIVELEKIVNNLDVGYSPENLRAMRLKNDLTQKNVADMLGVSVRTVMRWEKSLEESEHSDMPCLLWKKFYSCFSNSCELEDFGDKS